jgi:hypothetical protein
MTRALCMLALGAALAWPAVALTQSPPPAFNMKGTWKGNNEGLIDGVSVFNPSDAPNTAPAGKFRISRQTFTYVVDDQKGRLFWGTMGGEHQKGIRLMGSVSSDGKWVYMVTKDGYIDGQVIDADTIDSCYRHVNAQAAAVGCNPIKRQK